MKLIIAIIVSSLLVLVSCGHGENNDSRRFILRGEVIGQKDGKIILSYFQKSSRIIDTAILQDGKFLFEGRISEPLEAMIRAENWSNSIRIYLEPRSMKLILPNDNYEGFKLIGSKTQGEMNELLELESLINEQLSALKNQSIALKDSIGNSTTLIPKEEFERQANEIDDLISHLREERNLIWLRFIRSNPKSYISAKYLI